MNATDTLYRIYFGFGKTGQIDTVLRSPWSTANQLFKYSANGQLIYAQDADTLRSWDVKDGLGRIEKVQAETRLVTHSLSAYNAQKVIQENDAEPYVIEHNSRGDVVAEKDKVYDWDNENHLIKAGDVSYRYDSQGRLILRTQGSKHTTYIYDGNQVVEEINSDGSIKTYAWGDYIDEPVAIYSTSLLGAQNTLYTIIGLNKNVEAIANSSGQLVERYKINPYGEYSIWGVGPDGQLGSTDDQQFTHSQVGNSLVFQGRPYDAASGLYNIRARWYNPRLMSWMSVDPIFYEGGDNNLRRFVGNDPVNKVDPSGLTSSLFNHWKNGNGAYWDVPKSVIFNDVKWINIYGFDEKINEFCSDFKKGGFINENFSTDLVQEKGSWTIQWPIDQVLNRYSEIITDYEGFGNFTISAMGYVKCGRCGNSPNAFSLTFTARGIMGYSLLPQSIVPDSWQSGTDYFMTTPLFKRNGIIDPNFSEPFFRIYPNFRED